MPAATIVFTDIVSFSQKPTEEQKRLIEALNAEVSHELRSLLFPPYERPQVIALPTGDGMALAFVYYDHKHWTRETIFRLIHRLQKWAQEESSATASVALRLGIHTGPVELVTDINGKPNVCGNTINYAQRVMDSANARQVLLSEVAYRELIGDETKQCDEPFPATFGPPVQVTAKHDVPILVYPMRLREPAEFWDNAEPEAKWWLSVSPTPMPKEQAGKFRERRQMARHIAFVQLTGAGFLREYEEARQQGQSLLSPALARFWVFMPAPEAYERLGSGNISGTDVPLADYLQQWKALLTHLRAEHPNADFKLGLYQTLGYYASYLDWEQRGGFIHVSPYIWGVAAKDSPGFDIVWHVDEPPPPYQAYLDGLNYLNRITENCL